MTIMTNRFFTSSIAGSDTARPFNMLLTWIAFWKSLEKDEHKQKWLKPNIAEEGKNNREKRANIMSSEEKKCAQGIKAISFFEHDAEF